VLAYHLSLSNSLAIRKTGRDADFEKSAGITENVTSQGCRRDDKEPAPKANVALSVGRKLSERNMKKLLLIVALAAFLGPVANATAQVYPSHVITIVAAGPAGGPTDAIGRIIAERMRVSLGQPVLIENVAASGGIAVRRVGRAAPDGYTIELGHWGTNVVDGAVMPLPYDLLTDFEPIALIVSNPLLISGRKDLPPANLKELVAWLKENPGKATLAEPGAGSPPHIAGVFFEKLTGTEIQFVPYRGGGPAMQDLIAGHIDLNMGQLAIAIPQVNAGTIRAFAVTAESRIAAAPSIPTTDEAGVPGLHLSVWHGLWVPKGTPKDIVMKLNAAVVDALADPTVQQRLAQLGQDIPSRAQQTPEWLAAYQKAEIEKWWPIIRAAGIKIE
jgi:tripartite-type tricarboxylate transporter receptor subunit TctC